MTEMEKNNVQKLHELLDIALLCNGLNERKRSVSGMMPTMFLRFSGHVAAVSVDLYRNGWNDTADKQTDLDSFWVAFDEPIPDELIEKIRAAANSALADIPTDEELLASRISEAEEELKRRRAEITAMKRNLKELQKKGA